MIAIILLGRLSNGIDTRLSEKLIHHIEKEVESDERKARDEESTAKIVKAVRLLLTQPINHSLGAIFLVLLAEACCHENS